MFHRAAVWLTLALALQLGVPALAVAASADPDEEDESGEVGEGEPDEENTGEPSRAAPEQPRLASDDSPVLEPRERRYTTREEQRDEAPKHVITDWLSAAALVEVESFREEFDLRDSASRSHLTDTGRSLEAVLLLEPLPWLTGEIVWEYDFKTNRDNLDEAVVGVEAGPVQVELGRLYPPFGEFFSHFATGPVLDFAETRRTGVVLSYVPLEALDLSAYVLDGRAKRASSGGSPDWGMAFEATPFDFVTFGASYLSDLAESESDLLADTDRRYTRRVAAISGYAVASYDRFELTAEFVRALDSFNELEPDRNRPRAWNTEFAFYPVDELGFALRVEGSEELEDAPRRQYGVAAIWRLWSRVFVTVEALQGEFSRGLAEDERGREVDRASRVGALVSVDL